MNMRWFYVSLIFLFGILFNHSFLPWIVPPTWLEGPGFWQVVFGTDAVFLLGALASLGASLFLTAGGEEGRPPAQR